MKAAVDSLRRENAGHVETVAGLMCTLAQLRVVSRLETVLLHWVPRDQACTPKELLLYAELEELLAFAGEQRVYMKQGILTEVAGVGQEKRKPTPPPCRKMLLLVFFLRTDLLHGSPHSARYCVM